MRLNLRETAAVIAGLRLVAQRLKPVPGGEQVDEILTCAGQFRPLSVDEVCALGERIGTDDVVTVRA